MLFKSRLVSQSSRDPRNEHYRRPKCSFFLRTISSYFGDVDVSHALPKLKKKTHHPPSVTLLPRIILIIVKESFSKFLPPRPRFHLTRAFIGPIGVDEGVVFTSISRVLLPFVSIFFSKETIGNSRVLNYFSTFEEKRAKSREEVVLRKVIEIIPAS